MTSSKKKGIKRVLFHGSFDPIHQGHVSIIERACEIFEEVVVAVLVNPSKEDDYLLELNERAKLISEVFEDNPQVKVVYSYKINTVEIARKNGCDAIIRGIRGGRDVHNERFFNQIILTESDYEMDVLYILALPYENAALVVDPSDISSSEVRKRFREGQDLTWYCPDEVIKYLEKMKR
jgi:pantetheine-phosphate adenylyltransferase